MKKIIVTLAIAFSSVAVFASGVNVNSTVLTAFNSDFANAKEVNWTAGEDFYRADFVFNSQHVAAFYNLDGEVMGVTRNLTSLDLPMNLQASLRKDYSEYWISNLFEVSNSEGTEYYITLETADSKLTLKSTSVGKWKTFKKATKA